MSDRIKKTPAMAVTTLGHEQTDWSPLMDNSIQKTTLYRYYDNDGHLLYVGITGDNTKRQSQHRRKSFWFGEIYSASFEHFNNRHEASQAEVAAIQSERPRYNTQHLNSKQREFSPIDLWAKLHLLGLMSGQDINKEPIEIDEDHRNFKKALDKFDLKGNDYSLDECLVMELEHLVWREVQGDISLPNLDTCNLCQNLMASEWLQDTLISLDQKTEMSRRVFLNAAN